MFSCPSIGLEEWKLPGDFHYNYNTLQHSELPDRYPMNQFSDMWTILLAELMRIACLFFGVNQIIVIWHLTFCFLEMTGHLVFGFNMYNRFRAVGKKTIYNPGFVTAALFTIHALYYILTQYPANLPSLGRLVIGVLVGIFAVGGVALIPEQIFKSKDTVYPFASNRYYEKYIEREKG